MTVFILQSKLRLLKRFPFKWMDFRLGPTAAAWHLIWFFVHWLDNGNTSEWYIGLQDVPHGIRLVTVFCLNIKNCPLQALPVCRSVELKTYWRDSAMGSTSCVTEAQAQLWWCPSEAGRASWKQQGTGHFWSFLLKPVSFWNSPGELAKSFAAKWQSFYYFM